MSSSGLSRDDAEAGDDAARDSLIENYRTILNELSLLTTVSVLLFGFLLASPSIASSDVEQWVYAVAVVLIATATLVFILPVAYHHIQFPYQDFEKFQARTHQWLRFGLPLLGAGFYLSLVLSISSIFAEASILIAGMPIAATGILFYTRKADWSQ
jgi:fumarate reductase subunit D